MTKENEFCNDNSIDSEHNENDSDSSADESPSSLIVSSINPEVFNSPELKLKVENLFREFSQQVTFQWFKSFRRLRVNFEDPNSAAEARIQLHQQNICNSNIRCHFAQPIILNKHSNTSLKPPTPEKQFLLSPPPSPPLGWKQIEECQPIFNHELMTALSNLRPGEVHEIQAASDKHPAIIVETAFVELDGNNNAESDNHAKIAFIQTKCPERTSNKIL